MSLIVINIIIMTLSFNSCKSGPPRLALATCGPVYCLVFLVGVLNKLGKINTHEELEKNGQFVIRTKGCWSTYFSNLWKKAEPMQIWRSRLCSIVF